MADAILYFCFIRDILKKKKDICNRKIKEISLLLNNLCISQECREKIFIVLFRLFYRIFFKLKGAIMYDFIFLQRFGY